MYITVYVTCANGFVYSLHMYIRMYSLCLCFWWCALLALQDLLPGATGMLKAGGGSLFHNLPPLKSKPAVGSGKLAPLAGPLLSQVSAPGPLPGTGTGTPQSSYLKSGAGGGRGQPADSVLSQGVSRSPAADSAESVSPGLAYLKSPVQQAGLGVCVCVCVLMCDENGGCL